MGNILQKILLAIMVLLVAVGGIVYLLIYAPQLANNQQIIQIRHKYEGMVGQVRNGLKLPTTDHCSEMGTPIRVLTGLGWEGGYRYSLQGRLVAIDKDNSQMTLLCSNDKRYTFVIELKAGAEQGQVEIVGTSDEGTGRRKNKWVLSTSDGQYDQNHIYEMVWEDSRTLSQILSDYRQSSSEAINQDAKVRPDIRRYK
jgi:hypothetical protein